MLHRNSAPIFIGLMLASTLLRAQPADSTHTLAFPQNPYHEKAVDLAVSYHFQGDSRSMDSTDNFHFLGIGLQLTNAVFGGHHGPSTFSYGVGTEIMISDLPTIYGFRAGSWVSGYAFTSGLHLVYYTDFDRGNLKLRWDFGLGGRRLRVTMGFNIPTIYNRDFEQLRRQDAQLGVQWQLPIISRRMLFGN